MKFFISKLILYYYFFYINSLVTFISKHILLVFILAFININNKIIKTIRSFLTKIKLDQSSINYLQLTNFLIYYFLIFLMNLQINSMLVEDFLILIEFILLIIELLQCNFDHLSNFHWYLDIPLVINLFNQDFLIDHFCIINFMLLLISHLLNF